MSCREKSVKIGYNYCCIINIMFLLYTYVLGVLNVIKFNIIWSM